MTRSSSKAGGLGVLLLLAGCAPSPPRPLPAPPTAPAPPASAAPTPDTPGNLVEALGDPSRRSRAIEQLARLHDDEMTRHNGDPKAPAVAALHDRIVAPMTALYLRGDLDERDRLALLGVLARARDPRARDAIVKAVNDFAAGKASHEEMTRAAGYLQALRPKEAAGPLLDAFQRIEVSHKDLGPPYLATRDAMVAMADPSWQGKLIETLRRPLDIDERKLDKATRDLARNETYWQTVAAEVLGELRAEGAVRALFDVVRSPGKKNIAPSAVMALIRIGKASMPLLLDMLAGKDATIEGKKGPAIRAAALVLGSIGRADARGPMLAALKAAEDDETRVAIARELARLPPAPGSVKALRDTFERIAWKTTTHPGEPAKIALASAAEKLAAPELVGWALGQVRALGKAKAPPEDVAGTRAALLQLAMKLASKDQLDEVRKVVVAAGGDLEKENLAGISELLRTCGDDEGCYLARIEAPTREDGAWLSAIKAVGMLGAMNRSGVKARLLQSWPRVGNEAVQFEVLVVVDRLSPQGDPATADGLQKLLDGEVTRGASSPLVPALRQVIARLRARAM